MKKDPAVRGVEQQNLAHQEARGDIFRTPGGCDHENLMLEPAKSLTRKEEKFRIPE